jgi:hypothetical protein
MIDVERAKTAQRAYIASLVLGAAGSDGASAQLGCGDVRLEQEGLLVGGQVVVPADELDRMFASVTLQREIDTGRLDSMGMFDEPAATWDVSRPSVQLRALDVARKLGCPAKPGAGDGRFRVVITHDVDRTTFCEPTTVVKGAIRSLMRMRCDESLRATLSRRSLYRVYEWVLARERHYGVGAYFFMLAGPYGMRRYSSRCDIQWAVSRDLMRLITEAGMTVGLHGSYYARERDSYRAEKERVEHELGVPITCHRNHYLRFDPLTMWGQMEAAGISTDFSVGFNYRLGFRAGCGNLYPGFDLSQNRPSRVNSVPLLFMDGVLFGADRRMLLQGLRSALEEVKRVNGCVSLLFHPELFVTDPSLMDIFEEVLQMCVRLGADLSGALPRTSEVQQAMSAILRVGGGEPCVA